MIDYSDIVPSLLSLLGAGNWKMGGSSAPVLSLSSDSKAILSQYLCDALATTLEALQGECVRGVTEEKSAQLTTGKWSLTAFHHRSSI